MQNNQYDSRKRVSLDKMQSSLKSNQVGQSKFAIAINSEEEYFRPKRISSILSNNSIHSTFGGRELITDSRAKYVG